MLGIKSLHKSPNQSLFKHNRLAYMAAPTGLLGGHMEFNYAEAPGGLAYEPGANSAVFNKFDFVTLASGYLVVVSSDTDRPMGLCDASKTMASDNQTVAKVEVPFYPAQEDFMFEADFDAATQSQANAGTFYTITGSTGQQQISASSGSATVGQVVLEKFDPRGEGSLTRGLFRFAKTYQSYTVA